MESYTAQHSLHIHPAHIALYSEYHHHITIPPCFEPSEINENRFFVEKTNKNVFNQSEYTFFCSRLLSFIPMRPHHSLGLQFCFRLDVFFFFCCVSFSKAQLREGGVVLVSFLYVCISEQIMSLLYRLSATTSFTMAIEGRCWKTVMMYRSNAIYD